NCNTNVTPVNLSSETEHAARKVPESQDEIKQHRRNYLRSLLHDKNLTLPEQCAIAHIYIETGLGDPDEIVKELEATDWFHRCTYFDPTIDKAHLRQVKRRPRIDHRRQTRAEGETLTNKEAPSLESSVQDEVMTEGEEEEEDHHKLAALGDWLQHRLEQGIYRH
ncbi:hypothetical protein BGZ65_001221, partial [Modicella reniformis]